MLDIPASLPTMVGNGWLFCGMIFPPPKTPISSGVRPSGLQTTSSGHMCGQRASGAKGKDGELMISHKSLISFALRWCCGTVTLRLTLQSTMDKTPNFRPNFRTICPETTHRTQAHSSVSTCRAYRTFSVSFYSSV